MSTAVLESPVIPELNDDDNKLCHLTDDGLTTLCGTITRRVCQDHSNCIECVVCNEIYKELTGT